MDATGISHRQTRLRGSSNETVKFNATFARPKSAVRADDGSHARHLMKTRYQLLTLRALQRYPVGDHWVSSDDTGSERRIGLRKDRHPRQQRDRSHSEQGVNASVQRKQCGWMSMVRELYLASISCDADSALQNLHIPWDIRFHPRTLHYGRWVPRECYR